MMKTTAAVALVATLAVALMACPAAAAGRNLQQSDAWSNSNGCITSGVIPKCEQGACATRNIMGNARWVCLRCLSNYVPVVDASGQDNIIQCVCPKGTFEASPNSGNCTSCPLNAYCPGGDMVESPTTRGTNFTCGTSLVTRTQAARSQTDCVAPAGFAMTSPTGGSPCNAGEYAPMYNRLAKCLRCQSGLVEPPNSGLASSQRATKKAVCKIPPGKYVSQGLVRICPQGFYREQYVDFDAANGTICLPCNPGITTNGPQAGNVTLCNVVIPGYGINTVNTTNGVLPAIPVLPQSSTTGLPNATLCDIGYYSSGGYCAQCPNATVTITKGAKSIEECVVPPGYYLAGGAMPQCANSTFREGWLMYSDPNAASCTPCGDGIASEPRDLDVNPKAQNGSLVRATSASCFIESGMGMIAQGKNQFIGRDCPVNTYGAAGKVYGWASAPCKPCPRNMITDGATRVNNSDVCVNDDGFGYASEGASRCAPGFYSLKASRKPCQQCPAGRTTTALASQQRLITDCFVKPGFGVANSTANATDAFNPNLTGLDNNTLAVLPVLECPIGYYGAGNTTGAKCVRCPDGSSTPTTGAAAAAECTACLPGYGKVSGSIACSPCAYGTYQQGFDTTCTPCANLTFYGPVDGQSGGPFTSTSTTLYQGTINPEGCVPQQSQLSPEAGQAYFAPDVAGAALFTTTNNIGNLTACLAICTASPLKACMAQWDVTAKACRTVLLDLDVSDDNIGTQLHYKLPPATIGSASSFKPGGHHNPDPIARAKMMSSGYYAVIAVPTTNNTAWATVGTNLGPDARTFATGAAAWDNSSRTECKRKCDNSNVCWGFLYDPTANNNSGSCLYRGGVDTLASRAFFTLPNPLGALVGNLKW